MNGKIHHFGAIGFANGLSVLGDRETRTHWDHITGKAYQGPLAGNQLEVWSIRMTTVAAACEELPDLTISISGLRSIRRRLAQRLYSRFIRSEGFIPLPFFLSMNSPIDPRLDKLEQGLGVVVGRRAKFYVMDAIPAGGIQDDWEGRSLTVSLGVMDGVPRATWKDSGEDPFQLLSRWYGFSFTYPGCEVYRSTPD